MKSDYIQDNTKSNIRFSYRNLFCFCLSNLFFKEIEYNYISLPLFAMTRCYLSNKSLESSESNFTGFDVKNILINSWIWFSLEKFWKHFEVIKKGTNQFGQGQMNMADGVEQINWIPKVFLLFLLYMALDYYGGEQHFFY